MDKSMMAVGAHADDVELHFGGTLLKYRDKGYGVVYVMATNNMSGSVRRETADGRLVRTHYGPCETMEYRKRESEEAARLFGTRPVHLDHPQRHYSLGGEEDENRRIELRYGVPLPDGVPPDVPSILTAYADEAAVGRLTALVLEHRPEVIFTHGHAEINPEHYATALLTVTAYRKAVEEGYAGSLLLGVRQFGEWGRSACRWDTWIDITGYVDRRMEAVRKHASQYPPGWEGGAVYWREMAERLGEACGAGAAEVFNFVNAVEPGPDDGELLSELLRHRDGGPRETDLRE
jgi:LmbE family N-acetylglucosaminyl deacetylase